MALEDGTHELEEFILQSPDEDLGSIWFRIARAFGHDELGAVTAGLVGDSEAHLVAD